MGQRHQILIIARVQGRYRCIAMFHSQFMDGLLVVKTAARLMRAFVNPINAAAIASELATLEHLDASAIAREDYQNRDNPDILCPYLTSLVMTCARVDMEEGTLYNLILIDMHCLPSRLDNNEGFTCFDLTEAGSPRYCFLWYRTGPLTAYEYLRYEEDKRLDPSIYAIFGHCALVGLDTLAEVWPGDYRALLEQTPPGGLEGEQASADPTAPPNSTAFARSAASALHAIRETCPDWTSEAVMSELRGLATVLSLKLGQDGLSRLLSLDRPREALSSDATLRASTAGEVQRFDLTPDSHSCYSTVAAIFERIRSSKPELGGQDVASGVESLVVPQSHLRSLREELLAASAPLDSSGVLRLKRLLAGEQLKVVDLKPWVSTGALDAATLTDLSDALRHAECLDVSFSPTLTAEILETLVSRLPKIRHIIAFGCNRLVALSRALPLTTYFASLPMLDAIDQTRLTENDTHSAPECLRWAEESDPPAGLTIVLHAPSLLMRITPTSLVPIRYGLELGHFGAEGVVRGLMRYLERLYRPGYRPGQNGCYFEMRAYFHSTGSVPLRECIRTSHNGSASYTFGCLPSLIRTSSPEDGHAYPAMERSTASGAVTSVPRHPGWVLRLDTKGTMPYHLRLQPVIQELLRFTSSGNRATVASPETRGTVDGHVPRFSLDISKNSRRSQLAPDEASRPQPSWFGMITYTLSSILGLVRGFVFGNSQNADSERASSVASASVSAARTDASSLPVPLNDGMRPEYAFERWDEGPGTKELQVVERVSLREWVSRLPAGHGPVPEALLAECEAVLARLNVALRGSTDEPAATN